METLAPNAAKANAIELLKQGQLDEAIEILEEACETSPADSQLQSILGAAYARNGNKFGAISAFEEAVRLQETPKAHNNLALAYEQAMRIDEAEQQYEAAVRLDPSYQPAHDSIARIQKRRQEERNHAQVAQIAQIQSTPPESAPKTAINETPQVVSQQSHAPVKGAAVSKLRKSVVRKTKRVVDRHRQVTIKGLLTGALCGSVFILLLTISTRLFFRQFMGPMPSTPDELVSYLIQCVLVGVLYGAAVGWWVGFSESEGAGWRCGAVIGAIIGLIIGMIAGGGVVALILLGIYGLLGGLTGSLIGRIVESSIGWH